MKVPKSSNAVTYYYKDKLVVGCNSSRYVYKVEQDEDTGRLIAHLKNKTYWIEFLCIAFSIIFIVCNFIGYYVRSTILYDSMAFRDSTGNTLYVNIRNTGGLPIDYEVTLYENNLPTAKATLEHNSSVSTLPIASSTINEVVLEFKPKIFLGLIKKEVKVTVAELGRVDDKN